MAGDFAVNRPEHIVRVTRDETGTVVTADCRSMSGAEFFRLVHGDPPERPKSDLEAIAQHLGIPFDELKQRTKDQWL